MDCELSKPGSARLRLGPTMLACSGVWHDSKCGMLWCMLGFAWPLMYS